MSSNQSGDGRSSVVSERSDDVPADDAGSDQKAESPTDLTKRSWRYVARKTAHEFSDDQCTDLAAALTYYAVLALFPAAIAVLSLVGLFGQGDETVDTLLQILRDVGASSAADTPRADADRAQPDARRRARRSSSAWRRRCGRRPGTSAPSAGR